MKEWQDDTQFLYNYEGMVLDDQSQDKTGILRLIQPSGSIEEVTYYDGKRHGLSRKETVEDFETFVHVALYEHGNAVASFKFD